MLKSSFANEISAFLELRKLSVAHPTYTTDTATLTALDCYLTEREYIETDLSEEILVAWTRVLEGSSKTVKNKVLTARVFVKYLNAKGHHSFLPDVPNSKSDYIPYIYSDEEVSLLFHYADNLEFKTPNGIKSSSRYIKAKIPMILRILYGCGTRVEETLVLRRKDIDFKNRTIFLRETKFLKERLIPAHDTLIDILERYCLTLGIMLSPDAYLFPGRKANTHLTSRQLAEWFTEFLRLANIDQRVKKSGERGASLHCLRHLFVLKSMQQLEAAGHPVDLNDLLLPTYLGHENLLDTDKYMRFSGAQIPESLSAFETFTVGLIPKVEAPYEDE
jgi:integrase